MAYTSADKEPKPSLLTGTEMYVNFFRIRAIAFHMRTLAIHQFSKKSLANATSQVAFKFSVKTLVSEEFNKSLESMGVNRVSENDLNDCANMIFKTNPKVDVNSWEFILELKDIKSFHYVAKMYQPNELEQRHLGIGAPVKKETIDFSF